MDETHLSVFHSALNRAHGTHSRNSISSICFQLVFFFLSHARDCTTFTLHDLTDVYVERVTAHRIKIIDHSCFHNRWPTSKTKLKWKHLWEGGPWCFGGPMQLAYSVARIGSGSWFPLSSDTAMTNSSQYTAKTLWTIFCHQDSHLPFAPGHGQLPSSCGPPRHQGTRDFCLGGRRVSAAEAGAGAGAAFREGDVVSGSLCLQSPVMTLTWSQSPHYWSPAPVSTHQLATLPLSLHSSHYQIVRCTVHQTLCALTCVYLPFQTPDDLLAILPMKLLHCSWFPLSSDPATNLTCHLLLSTWSQFLAINHPVILLACCVLPCLRQFYWFIQGCAVLLRLHLWLIYLPEQK